MLENPLDDMEDMPFWHPKILQLIILKILFPSFQGGMWFLKYFLSFLIQGCGSLIDTYI
jgi:hypothetical protein